MARGLVLASDGVDASQLEYISHRLREDAVLVTVATPGGSPVEAAGGRTWSNTEPIAELSNDYDLGFVPGGSVAERLRLNDEALKWLREHYRKDGIIGTIGHGIQLLTSIDGLHNRTVTGPPELQIDIENSGAKYTADLVTVDGTLVTARDSCSLPFFVPATLNNSLIPQDPASEAQERPHWEST